MKKSLIVVLGFGIAAFGIITILKQRGAHEAKVESLDPTPDRRRVVSFWEIYHQATQQRVQSSFEEAIASYRQALEIEPEHEESLYYLGNCLLELGEFEAALGTYRRLVDLNPASQRGHAQIGSVLSTYLPGAPFDLSRARAAFERVVEINQEQAGPFLQLGLISLWDESPDEALAHFETAAGFRSPQGYYLAGFVRFSLGQHAEALSLFGNLFQTSQFERALAKRGMAVEGDLDSEARAEKLSPLEAAVQKAKLLAFWSASAAGGYPDEIPEEYRHSVEASRFEGVAVRQVAPGGGRGAWGDFDGDGDQDLIVFSSERPPVLIRNDRGRMLRVASTPGLAAGTGHWDGCWGDYDGDGDLDLYVIRAGLVGSGQNTLLENQGGWEDDRGRFVDRTEAAGLNGERSTWQVLCSDFDLDGRQDLVEVGSPSADVPAVRLFRNMDGKVFQEQSRTLGIDFVGLPGAIAPGDYDGDGDEDLYVMRWHRSGILYRNERTHFTDQTAMAGLDGVDGNGFSSLFFDYDRDGRTDLLVTSFAPYVTAVRSMLDPEFTSKQYFSRLFRNQGNGTFLEVTSEVLLNRGYGVVQAAAADLNQDGWTDLVLAAGGFEKFRVEPSVVLRNEQGKKFTEAFRLPEGMRSPSRALGSAAATIRPGRVAVHLAGVGLVEFEADR